MKKCQSAIEYLFSYGWIFIILVIIGVILYYTGVFNPSPEIKRSWDFEQFQVIDWKVSGSDSPYMNNTFHIVIGNKISNFVTVNYINVYDSEMNYCGSAVLRDYEIKTSFGEEWDTGGVLYKNCTGEELEDYKYYIIIGYKRKSGLDHEDKGFVEFHHEDIDDVIHFGDWFHSDYGSDIVISEPGSKLGSYNNTCPAEIPPTGNFTFVPGGGPINWGLPTGCSTSECHGVGQSGYCSQTCTHMAHGWLKSEIIAPRETRGHKVYLWGNATCDNSSTYARQGYYCPSQNTGFICMDDDFYFYVNTELLGYSGLSYSPYKCPGQCGDFDNWCIPPVDVTASPSFKWDSPNTVYVLIEDWCTGGGMGYMNFHIDPE